MSLLPIAASAAVRLMLLVSGVASGLLLTGCEGGQHEVLATFDGGEVTRAELDAHLRWSPREGAAVSSDRSWRLAVVRELAVGEIVSASDDTAPLAPGPLARARERLYELAMRRRLGWLELELSGEAVRAYYDEHPALFVDPERLRLQHIFLRSSGGAATACDRAAVRSELQRLRRRLDRGADFAALAREFSDSADGPAGGWMVLERGARTVRAFTDVVWNLEPDELSPIIDTPTGFHLARVATRVPARERPFALAREKVSAAALDAERARLEDEFLRTRGAVHDLRRDYSRLAQRSLRDRDPLFSLAGTAFAVSNLLTILPHRYWAYFHAGYAAPIERLLDQEALRRLLVLEAVAIGLDRGRDMEAALEVVMASLRGRETIERRLTARAAAWPEAEVKAQFERNRSRYEQPRQRAVSLIRLAPSARQGLWDLLREGEQLVAELAAGGDFETIARLRSQDSSYALGGRLSLLTDAELQMRIQSRSGGRRMLDELRVGEVSRAFIGEVYDADRQRVVPTGVYIVRLDEEIPARRRSFEQAERQARADLMRRNLRRHRQAIETEILEAAHFEPRRLDRPLSNSS